MKLFSQALGFLTLLCLRSFVHAVSNLKLPAITQLFQNNLNWTDDVNHVGALLLDPLSTYTEAQSACTALGETLLSPSTFLNHSADFIPQFDYLAFQERFLPTQEFWINNRVASVVAGLPIIAPISSQRSLPTLCTQSSTGAINAESTASSKNIISIQSKNNNTFTGFRNLKSFRFLGVPYADPIIRFQHSTVNSQTNHEFYATEFGPECVQVGAFGGSEQCLFLNIFTPFIPSSESDPKLLKPVLFWIHGGAFTSGTGSDATFDGGNIVSRGDVVMVTINYRLSTLGFLSIPGTTITGNYGIGDQITALQWVQENIFAFGGDPTRVTIMGQSAGAGSVRALMASPLAHGKFAAASPVSNLDGFGFAMTYSLYYTPTQEAALFADSILQATNCASADPTTIKACLSDVDSSVLIGLPSVASFVTVDGQIIVADGLNVTSSSSPGFTAQVPVLMGSMADDGAPFIGFPLEGENLTSALDAIVTANLTSAVLQSRLFPIPNTGNATLDIYNVTARVTTDGEFRCLDQATVFSAVKHKALPTVFYYQFDRAYQTPGFNPNAPVCQPPMTATHPFGDPSLPYFKCHSGDLYFEFGTLGQFGLPYRDDFDLPFSQLINDYWSSFVRSHDPNPDPAFLIARGYTSTLSAIQRSDKWMAVSAMNPTLQRLDFPSHQDSFLELDQCIALGFALNFYENNVQSFSA